MTSWRVPGRGRIDHNRAVEFTFDGKTIRHYANGQPIGSGASFTPPALLIGTAELGNWNGNTRRNLAAAMDEFAILSRVLSAEELSALFGFGRQ